ncbi:energy-coupling factor transporter ATPase [Macrococcoides caseolyticum]|uniref:energy-coupling factor transporter ATPase n=1 Tax=Macrococcoides caseolyticum TaxID=69966 RepID=UPI001F1951E1|nr:energy-coupling factor transporter ATPase [Macrococcus caseolyticus]MCE4957840.1 energy-coupling factor transporter ATPase [Macrococcus caseolyticus]
MEPIIEVNNLTFTYDGQSVPAIRNLSFTIKKGEWISIVGHNSSGKSTLLKLLGAIEPSQVGEIIIDNIPLTEATIQSVHERLGIVFQNPDNQFVGATVEDDIAFGLENYGVPHQEMHKRVEVALQAVEMTDMKRHEPHHLSGGQKQRVAIAGVLALQPKIIILDEATSMLDPEGRIEILNIIRKLQEVHDLTIIHITHHLEETLESDRIFVMNKGELVMADTPQVIYQHAEALMAIGLDLPFEMKVNNILFNHFDYITQEELLKKL